MIKRPRRLRSKEPLRRMVRETQDRQILPDLSAVCAGRREDPGGNPLHAGAVPLQPGPSCRRSWSRLAEAGVPCGHAVWDTRLRRMSSRQPGLTPRTGSCSRLSAEAKGRVSGSLLYYGCVYVRIYFPRTLRRALAARTWTTTLPCAAAGQDRPLPGAGGRRYGGPFGHDGRAGGARSAPCWMRKDIENTPIMSYAVKYASAFYAPLPGRGGVCACLRRPEQLPDGLPQQPGGHPGGASGCGRGGGHHHGEAGPCPIWISIYRSPGGGLACRWPPTASAESTP